MKVAVLGGDPAGLYFAISTKLCDAAHDVTVFGRNRADDTLGWGVVLPDETLDSLAANDPERAPAHRTLLDLWQKTLDLNLTGAFLRVRPAIEPMKRAGLLPVMWTLLHGQAAPIQPANQGVSCRTSPPQGGRSAGRTGFAIRHRRRSFNAEAADLPPYGGDGRQDRGGNVGREPFRTFLPRARR